MCGRGQCTYSSSDYRRFMNTRLVRRPAASRRFGPSLQPAATSSHANNTSNKTDGNRSTNDNNTNIIAVMHGKDDNLSLTDQSNTEELIMVDNACDESIFKPVYNLSPGMTIPVVYSDVSKVGSVDVCIYPMVWGLIPSHSPLMSKGSNNISDHYRMFNARIETVHEKNSFKNLLPANRCVVLMNGFYEWKGNPGHKIPYFIRYAAQDTPMIFPALFDATSSGLLSFTILTCDACPVVATLHDRQPVMLSYVEAREWLDLRLNYKTILEKLEKKSYTDLKFCIYQVSNRMTNPKYQGTDCADRVDEKLNVKKMTFFSPKSFLVKSENDRRHIPDSPPDRINDVRNDSEVLTTSSPVPNQQEISCPLCDTNISLMSESDRVQHVNNCLDTRNDHERRDRQCSGINSVPSILGKRQLEH